MGPLVPQARHRNVDRVCQGVPLRSSHQRVIVEAFGQPVAEHTRLCCAPAEAEHVDKHLSQFQVFLVDDLLRELGELLFEELRAVYVTAEAELRFSHLHQIRLIHQACSS